MVSSKNRQNMCVVLKSRNCFFISLIKTVSRPVNLHPLFLKIGHPAFWKKQSAKNQGHCNSKREEAAWSLLFLNKEWPCFFQPAFYKKQGAPFFKKQGAQFLRIVGADWLGTGLSGSSFCWLETFYCRICISFVWYLGHAFFDSILLIFGHLWIFWSMALILFLFLLLINHNGSHQYRSMKLCQPKSR